MKSKKIPRDKTKNKKIPKTYMAKYYDRELMLRYIDSFDRGNHLVPTNVIFREGMEEPHAEQHKGGTKEPRGYYGALHEDRLATDRYNNDKK